MSKYFAGFIHIAISMPIVWLVFVLIGELAGQSVFQALIDNNFAYIIGYTLIIAAINIIKGILHRIEVNHMIKFMKAVAKANGFQIEFKNMENL